MSNTKSPYEEIEDDGISTVCIYCGQPMHAGKYPPVHDGYCRYWFDIEIDYVKSKGIPIIHHKTT